jgi:hypothetical protein
MRTGWDGGGAALDEFVVGWTEGLGAVCDGGEALGVERGQAECRAPDVELQHHGKMRWGALESSFSGIDGVSCQRRN